MIKRLRRRLSQGGLGPSRLWATWICRGDNYNANAYPEIAYMATNITWACLFGRHSRVRMEADVNRASLRGEWRILFAVFSET